MNRLHVVILALLLAAATLAVYWRVRGFDFVNYDDVGYISQNDRVQQGLTVENIAWALTAGDLANWHPVTWLSHMADAELFGSDSRAAGWHHLENALWHTTNSVILFVLLAAMTGAMWRSWLVAALFALHPLHVESVAWIAERKDVLSAFFGLLTIAAYVAWVRQRKLKWMVLCVVLLALGLMTKPMLVTLPFVLLLLDYWPLDRMGLLRAAPTVPEKRSGKKENAKVQQPAATPATVNGLLIEKLPLIALVLASSVITVIAQKHGGALQAIDHIELPTRLANAIISCAKYMTQAIWPARMAVLYPYLPPNPVELFASAAVLIVVTFAAFAAAKRFPQVIVGWLWFLGMLVPVIGIVQVGEQSRADRYTYLPLIGLFMIVAWMIPRPRVKSPAALALRVVPIAAALVALWIVTYQQVSYWRDSVTLYTHALDVTADNPVMHHNLGVAYMQRGEPANAVPKFREALQLRPQYIAAKRNLGRVLITMGQNDEGVQCLEEAVRTDPTYVESISDLGVGYLQQGKSDQAIEQFKRAADLDKDIFLPRLNLGSAYFTQHRFADAIPWLEQALRIEPNEGQALYFMGASLLGLNRAEESLPYLQRAVQVRPTLDARINLANVLLSMNRPEEAIEQYQQILLKKPDVVPALGNLGQALARVGRYGEAITQTRRVIELAPTNPAGYAKLAELLLRANDPKLRDPAQALQLAQKACDLSSHGDPEFLGVLAQAQAANGTFNQAVQTAQAALDMARSKQMTALATELQRRLTLYQSGRAE